MQQLEPPHLQPAMKDKFMPTSSLQRKLPLPDCDNAEQKTSQKLESHTHCHQSLSFLHNTVTQVARPRAIRVTGGIACAQVRKKKKD